MSWPDCKHVTGEILSPKYEPSDCWLWHYWPGLIVHCLNQHCIYCSWQHWLCLHAWRYLLLMWLFWFCVDSWKCHNSEKHGGNLYSVSEKPVQDTSRVVYDYTPISRNIKPACLMLCGSPSSRQGSSDPSRHGHWVSGGVLWCVWCQDVGGGFFGSSA